MKEAKKETKKKLGFPCKKPRLKNIDSTRLKSNENRSGNLISRCFERKEKEKKNKQERGYIRSTQNFLLFPRVTRQSVEIVKFILVINEIDRRTLCLNFKILPVDIALSRFSPSR